MPLKIIVATSNYRNGSAQIRSRCNAVVTLRIAYLHQRKTEPKEVRETANKLACLTCLCLVYFILLVSAVKWNSKLAALQAPIHFMLYRQRSDRG